MNIATGKLTDKGLANLHFQIGKLNKRSAKLGLVPMVVKVLGFEVIETQCHITLLPKSYRLHEVVVEGEVPRVNGWVVAAKIEFTEVGNFVSCAPGIEGINPAYRTAENTCEHCNKKRHRNDLVVIRHEDGSEKVVGRNCLADFIRTGDAETLLKAAAFVSEVEACMGDDEGFGWPKGAEAGYLLSDLLKAASLCTRKLGWVPVSAAQFAGDSTKASVLRLLNPPNSGRDLQEWEFWVDRNNLQINEFDHAEAALAAEWLKTIPTNTPSDYLHQLRVLRDLDFVPDSKVGHAVSIIAAAKRARDEEIKRTETKKLVGPHVGQVGERLRGIKATVAGVFSKEGLYGVTTIVNFRTPEGSRLTWFASGDQTELYGEGSEHVLTFTVKKHDDHEKYGKATVIQRVKTQEAPIEQAAS